MMGMWVRKKIRYIRSRFRDQMEVGMAVVY